MTLTVISATLLVKLPTQKASMRFGRQIWALGGTGTLVMDYWAAIDEYGAPMVCYWVPILDY